MIAGSPATNPERSPGRLERLDRLWNTTQRSKRVAAGGLGRLQQARRRRGLVQVDLRVALVGGDDEVVALGELQRALQILQRQHRAGRIARAAQKQHLAALPHGLRHRVEIRQIAVGGGGVEEVRLARRPAAPRPRRSGRTDSA